MSSGTAFIPERPCTVSLLERHAPFCLSPALPGSKKIKCHFTRPPPAAGVVVCYFSVTAMASAVVYVTLTLSPTAIFSRLAGLRALTVLV